MTPDRYTAEEMAALMRGEARATWVDQRLDAATARAEKAERASEALLERVQWLEASANESSKAWGEIHDMLGPPLDGNAVEKVCRVVRERDEARVLLRRVVAIVPDAAMFEAGEDPHPPSVLRTDITSALGTENAPPTTPGGEVGK